jgi:hypothetical protein
VLDVLEMSHNADNVTEVQAIPLQFHFHTDSEHAVNGGWFIGCILHHLLLFYLTPLFTTSTLTLSMQSTVGCCGALAG